LKTTIKTPKNKNYTTALLDWRYLLLFVVIQGVMLYVYLRFAQGTNSPLGIVMLAVIYYISRKVSVDTEGVLKATRQWVAFALYLAITVALGVLLYVATII
jgi:hypothetical protein